MNNLALVLLQQTPKGAGSTQIIMLLLIVVVFYFFMIRPQMKRQKEVKKFRESLKKGDKVVTNGGIYGKIADIKEDHMMVEIADGVKVKFDKSAILKDVSDIPQQK